VSSPHYGISHSGHGDIVNHGNQAFGPHAVAGGTDVTALIDELRRAVLEHRASLPAQSCVDAHAELAAIADEVEAPARQRDPGRIRRALTALTVAVGSVAALATKAESLRQAVEGLIH
jgi:tRNA A37 N6-isopentenylltransferase MiaA